MAIYLKENILIALEGILSNKVRAILTMLGIIIGIGSVIAIGTIGEALSDSVSSQIARFGVTNIMVTLQNKDTSSSGVSLVSGSITPNDLISDEMIERYQEQFQDSIAAISLSNSCGGSQVRIGRNYANVTLMGANDGYAIANDVKILQGRFIQTTDLQARRYVVVVSDKFANNLFPAEPDCLGKEISAEVAGVVQTFAIIGVYQYQTPMSLSSVAAADKDTRTNMFIPLHTINMLTSSEKGYVTVTVNTKKNVNIPDFSKKTKAFFNIFYEKNTKFEIAAISMESMLSIVTDIMGTVSIAVAFIAGISLIVGGIGIMNIMLVSVTERTREIGTRKALGARSSSIQIQFIVEAVMVSGSGGALGILFGSLLGYGGSLLLEFPKGPKLSIVLFSVLFSMLIGVFFGFYPANKAAKLEPVEALRYE